MPSWLSVFLHFTWQDSNAQGTYHSQANIFHAMLLGRFYFFPRNNSSSRKPPLTLFTSLEHSRFLPNLVFTPQPFIQIWVFRSWRLKLSTNDFTAMHRSISWRTWLCVTQCQHVNKVINGFYLFDLFAKLGKKSIQYIYISLSNC